MTDLPKNKKGLNFYSLPKGRTHGILAFGYHKGRYLSQATEEFIRIARKTYKNCFNIGKTTFLPVFSTFTALTIAV